MELEEKRKKIRDNSRLLKSLERERQKWYRKVLISNGHHKTVGKYEKIKIELHKKQQETANLRRLISGRDIT